MDEVFLDDIESLLAFHWEEFSAEEISHSLIESFEVFDLEEQGSIDRKRLMEVLSSLGEMPLTNQDFELMFSMMDPSKTTFDYRLFVRKLCGLEQTKKKKKKKKKKRKN